MSDYVPDRGPCGHMHCAGHPACTYWPGTYTPATDVHVDHCAGTTCTHCTTNPTTEETHP